MMRLSLFVTESTLKPPSCIDRGCSLTVRLDNDSLEYVYQHGDNPEAVLVLCGAENRTALATWAGRIHRYQESLPE